MKIIVVNRRPSGCDPHSATLTPLAASTPSFDGAGHCYATIYPGLSWENPCDAGFILSVTTAVYYDLPTPTLLWTSSPQLVTITPGADFAALADSGPIAYDLSTGGSGPIYRVVFTVTYPDTTTALLTTDDDYTGSCT